jgi:GDP-4-dehydro-6-deoxy-D-mannose reductase
LIKALITGVNGFVGPYLVEELVSNGYTVFGCSLEKESTVNKLAGYFSCDITNPLEVEKVINSIKPDVVFHLAGFSSVSKSFENPELCFKINVEGTKNIIDSFNKLKVFPKLILISSAEVYGQPVKNPVNESAKLNSLSPYANSKIEQEKVALTYKNSIIVRAFNHTGVNQPLPFVIPSFRKQVAEAKEGGEVLVGNIDITKDFSNVLDVVKAYKIIFEKGKVGEIYNVGSGKGYLLRSVLEKMIKESGKSISIAIDPKKYRPADITELVCDNSKIKKLGIKIKGYFD